MLCSFKSKLRTWMFEICSPFWDFTLAASKNLYGILACENSRLFLLLAARESFRQEGRQGLKFHTDDEKSVRNLVRSWSSYIVLAIVYEWPEKTKGHEGQMKMWWIYYKTVNSLNIFFLTRSIWVLLELVRRRTQNFTVIDQEKHKIEELFIWTIHLRNYSSSVWNFCCWGADVPPGETSLAARSAERPLFSQANGIYPLRVKS